ncbi:HTH cro/C1-type domain-containing protein [Frankia sp. AiPs1]|uniref:helix-turn-helix domain-containing protein n=1 Tax=Frankia sp. AiPa1 TaxID=573492 RepID=UPI00202B0066|nr:helix-turn-helix transcriptional regulator [Frankia sp. AiPa1]MCL9761353.1 helix-turn-helix domain-containing protein [Frankia sp. AiPa1]
MDGEDDSAAALGRRIRQLRGRTSQDTLSRRIGFHRTRISKVENGEMPSADLCSALDAYWGTGGELAAWQARLDGSGEATANRREVFEFSAAGLIAAETYRRRTRIGPDPLTLAELDDAIDQHAAVFTTTAHDALAPLVYRTWTSAETLLDAGAKARAQAKLTAIAGYSSYMLSRLAFNLGDQAASRRFVTQAGDHAEQVDDPVLSASVAAMTSTLAFYGQQHATAVDLARRAPDHPYTRARLAAYEARGLTVLGDRDGAHAALDRMRRSAVDVPPRPGSSPFGAANAEWFRAGLLARLGAGREAEPIARTAVDAFDRGQAVGFEDHGHALLVLATTLVYRDQPEPAEAAALGQQAVTILSASPTHTLRGRVGRLGNDLSAHGTIPEVAQFREQLTAVSRPALMGG